MTESIKTIEKRYELREKQEINVQEVSEKIQFAAKLFTERKFS